MCSIKRWIPIALAVATPATARQRPADPIITDRPDFTESVVTVPVGRVQIEGGYTFAWNRDTRKHALGEILLRVPLGGRVEGRLGINSFAWRRSPAGEASGLEDAALGVKLHLAQGTGGRPAVAVLAATTLPTGASGVGAPSLQPEAKLALAWDLSERTGLSSNLNYARASDEEAHYDQFSASLSIGHALGERLGSYIEVFGFAPEGRGGPDAAFLNGGLTYLLSADLQVDARVGRQINGPDPGYFIGIGVSRRW